MAAVAEPTSSAGAHAQPPEEDQPSYICTSVTASTVDAFLEEIKEAEAAGVDIVELRLDFLKDFDPELHLVRIIKACKLPYIVTYRPVWEGGNYDGPEAERLAVLKVAALMGAPYVDVEFKAASFFFAEQAEVPLTTKVILSYHDFKQTPDEATLALLARRMREAGADIVKIAAMANDIADAARMLNLLRNKTGPTIALSMGERGQVTRLLAAKYGGYLTFAALSAERASAPGQPDIHKLVQLYRYREQRRDTQVFGVIGNPISHSRSPLIHNAGFKHIGFGAVYVPLLVDDLGRFLDAFADDESWAGFSVTIPHKEAALRLSAEVEETAGAIGAVNTMRRLPPGSEHAKGSKARFAGSNTDWSAAIGAIERAMTALATPEAGSGAGVSAAGQPLGPATASPLRGKTVVVVGAGGAGRALAFGAATRGAKVVVANRSRDRADALAQALGGSARACSWEDLAEGRVEGDVLANSTSVGMAPKTDESPVPREVVGKFKVVFDAVYTPLWTRLLLDAKDQGCAVVDGTQMFLGQALDQFRIFAGAEPPADVMRSVLMDNLGAAKKA